MQRCKTRLELLSSPKAHDRPGRQINHPTDEDKEIRAWGRTSRAGAQGWRAKKQAKTAVQDAGAQARDVHRPPRNMTCEDTPEIRPMRLEFETPEVLRRMGEGLDASDSFELDGLDPDIMDLLRPLLPVQVSSQSVNKSNPKPVL